MNNMEKYKRKTVNRIYQDILVRCRILSERFPLRSRLLQMQVQDWYKTA